jgi:hypothetical protein
MTDHPTTTNMDYVTDIRMDDISREEGRAQQNATRARVAAHNDAYIRRINDEERARMNATRARIAASVETYVYPDSDGDEEGGTRPVAISREMVELE